MRIETVEALEAIYGTPNLASTAKVADRITPEYARLIAASPFMVLATVGPEGLDASPRGDAHGLVRIDGDRSLLLPDRRGNNRVDSLRNIVRDPRVGLLFLIPGSGTTLRVNGRAYLSIEPDLLDSFAVDGAPPRSVAVIAVEEIFFQCARAVVRAGLWDAARHAAPGSLPTPGQILAVMSRGETGGEAYDREWPARAAKTMW
jgi:PPOX class probable FMN-dependent enzyme